MTLVDPLSSLARARASVLRTSTAERVADAVREEVVEGRLRPGARLPEQALCDALGVSRNTVREALSQLVNERVLAREPNRGVFVAQPDAAAVRDVYRVRRLVERARRGGPRRWRACGRRSTKAAPRRAKPTGTASRAPTSTSTGPSWRWAAARGWTSR